MMNENNSTETSIDTPYGSSAGGLADNLAQNWGVSLDWGLSFAKTHKKLLLAFVMLPACIEIFISYLYYQQPLSDQYIFLTFVFLAGSKSWFIAVISMSCLLYARGDESLSFSKISTKALQGLPKIFLSYLAFISFVSLSTLIRPLLIIVILLIWAPIFCVAEQCLAEKKEEKDTDKEPEDIYTAKRKDQALDDAPSLLVNKSIFELGFARAVQLGIKNLKVTIQVGLLLWCSNIVPAAFIQLLFPDSAGFLAEVVRIGITSWFNVFAVSAAAGAFIFLLNKQSKSELGICEESYLKKNQEKVIKKVTFHENLNASIALAFIALSCTFFLVHQIRNAKSLPEDLIAEIRDVSVKGESLSVKISLDDVTDRFRWFDASSFRIVFLETPTLGMEADKAVEISEKSLIVPSNFNVKFNGKNLPRTNFTPIDGPLEVLLQFSLPKTVVNNDKVKKSVENEKLDEVEAAEKGLAKKEGARKGEFTLFYSTLFKKPEKVAEGRYGSW